MYYTKYRLLFRNSICVVIDRCNYQELARIANDNTITAPRTPTRDDVSGVKIFIYNYRNSVGRTQSIIADGQGGTREFFAETFGIPEHNEVLTRKRISDERRSRNR